MIGLELALCDLNEKKPLHEWVLFAAQLMCWLATECDKQKINIDGYLVANDPRIERPSILIYTSTEIGNTDMEKIQKILKQPPGEFKGRYYASFIQDEEPDGVVEVKGGKEKT